jgi:hypothetical protein
MAQCLPLLQELFFAIEWMLTEVLPRVPVKTGVHREHLLAAIISFLTCARMQLPAWCPILTVSKDADVRFKQKQTKETVFFFSVKRDLFRRST